MTDPLGSPVRPGTLLRRIEAWLSDPEPSQLEARALLTYVRDEVYKAAPSTWMRRLARVFKQ